MAVIRSPVATTTATIVAPPVPATTKPNGTGGHSPIIKPPPPSHNPSLWGSVPTAFTRRCGFIEILGGTGEGRTSIALSAPGPIAYFHEMNEKLPGIVEQYAHKIGPHGDGVGGMYSFGDLFRGTVQEIEVKAKSKWNDFMLRWDDAWKWARTIIVDTDTDLYKLLRLSEFGKLSQVKPIFYGPVNAKWSGLFAGFRQQHRCHVICIGKLKEEYKADKATGRMVHDCNKDHEFNADIIVRTSKKKGSEGTQFYVTIDKAWRNGYLEGTVLQTELTGDVLTGASVGELLEMCTDVPAGEWM